MRRLIIGWLMMLGVGLCHGGEVQDGAFTVHYSVFNSAFLSADVARAYGVNRAGDRAVINVAVRESVAGGDRAAHAEVSGTHFDLVHRRPLAFREIVETGAIYYIAEFPFSNEETQSFNLTVQPEGAARSIPIEFNQKFYVDK